MVPFSWICGLMVLLCVALVLCRLIELGRFGRAEGNTGDHVRAEFGRDAALRTKSELRFRLFVECASAAEEVSRSLVTWSQLLTAHVTSVVFDASDEGYRQSAKEQQEQLKATQRAGLFLPPDLDPPLSRALKAFMQVVTTAGSAQQKQEVAERRELCRPALQKMEQELEMFINAVRVWKKRGFAVLMNGDAEIFSDPSGQDGGRITLPGARPTLGSYSGNEHGAGESP